MPYWGVSEDHYPSAGSELRPAGLERQDTRLSRLVPIQTSFNLPKFEPRTVYFFDTQKLPNSSRLVRGYSKQDDGQEPLFLFRPDNMQNSIWDTIN